MIFELSEGPGKIGWKNWQRRIAWTSPYVNSKPCSWGGRGPGTSTRWVLTSCTAGLPTRTSGDQGTIQWPQASCVPSQRPGLHVAGQCQQDKRGKTSLLRLLECWAQHWDTSIREQIQPKAVKMIQGLLQQAEGA